MHKFRLFISGFGSKTSQTAINQVKSILEGTLREDDYALSIIDIVDNPECARRKMVFATPVLVKHYPKPERRVFGSFRDTRKVLESVGIDLTNQD